MSHSSRIRILFVHQRSELGGAPGSLAQLISELDNGRFEAHVYCPPGPSARLFREAGGLVHEGPVASFTHIWASFYEGRRWLLLVSELARLPRHAASFERTLRDGRFDLVHLNDSPLLPAAWLARRRRVPVIWHLRSAPPHAGVDRRSRFMREAIFRLADASIAINGDVARLWGIAADVVPDPVNVDRFSPGDQAAARIRLGLPISGDVVGYVGFLYPSKGFVELIRAAALLRRRGIETRFIIAGGGVRDAKFFGSAGGRLLARLGLARDYEAEARRLVAELKLGDSVRLAPYTAEVEFVYHASDLVVAPSQGPELGLSMLEAAASGIAAVATGSRTGAGILQPGTTTLLADGFGPEAIADAIAELLQDAPRRAAMGAAGRELAVRTFDPARHARLVEEIYERVLADRASGRSPGKRR